MIENPCSGCVRECPPKCKEWDDFISLVQSAIDHPLDAGRMVDAALFSSECDEWGTPKALYAKLNEMFGPFDMDPCTSPDNPLGTPIFYTKETDGLAQTWDLGDPDHPTKVYMNPPYGRKVGDWIYKAWLSSLYGRAVVVCLLPARTDTRWWHGYVMSAESIYFIRGRLTFRGATNTAPFPSVVVVFKATPHAKPYVFSLEVPK